MASYLGDYTNDVNRLFKQVKLDVYLVTGSSLTTFRGTRNNTSESFDNNYLPNIWRDNVVKAAKNKGVCDLTFNQRFLKLYINSSDYLRLPMPFLPNSVIFNQCLLECSQNQNIISIGLIGENIDGAFLKYYV